MDLKTETRYVVEGPGPGGNYPSAAAARKAQEKLERDHRKILGREVAELPDAPFFAVRQALFAVERFAVVSNRDGELVVQDLDEATAEAEAARLSAEQHARRHGGVIAGEVVEAQPLNTGDLAAGERRDVGADRPTTTYSVVPLADREIPESDEEA